MSPRNLVLTGYGPFGEHDVNVSWLAVEEARKIWKEEGKEKEVKEQKHFFLYITFLIFGFHNPSFFVYRSGCPYTAKSCPCPMTTFRFGFRDAGTAWIPWP